MALHFHTMFCVKTYAHTHTLKHTDARKIDISGLTVTSRCHCTTSHYYFQLIVLYFVSKMFLNIACKRSLLIT